MRNPNVVFILADDLGWGDVGYHGSDIRTPNIDRLARRGVELDRHYVCPVCTPTRAALMTGRHPGRFGRHATAPSNLPVLPDNYYTLAHLFRNAGYATGLFGKWHLGSDPRQGPNHYGFDTSYGSFAGGVDPYSHLYKPGPYVRTWQRNGRAVDEPGHVTDLITNEAVGWIKRSKRPFFCYLPFTAVHTPIRPPEAWIDRYEGETYSDDPVKNEAFQRYAAYTSHMDHAIGRVVEALKCRNILDETLVVFASDNGAVTYETPCDRMQYPGYRDDMQPAGCNLPLRGRKHTLYEGGIRTPGILSWPGHLEPGKVEAPMHISDWMPTFASMLDVQVPGDPRWDGQDMWPMLSGAGNAPPPRSLYWNLHHRHFALQESGWKLIRREPEDEAPLELFHLAEDPCETRNVAGEHPDRVAHLTERIEAEFSRENESRRPDVEES